jgi:hypothetical protein
MRQYNEGSVMRSIFLLSVIILAACSQTTSPVSVLPTAGPLPNLEPSPVEFQTPPTVTIVEVPSSVIQIDGVSYLSYQTPGDPWRFVCQEPCAVDPTIIFAQYAGFRNAHEIMLALTGVDPVPQLLPVDFHLTNDALCGTYSDSLMNGVQAFAYAYPDRNAYACTWLFEYAGVSDPYAAEDAVQLYNQTIFIHEYLHAVFIGRFPTEVEAFHDFVTPLAVYIGQVPEDLCGYHPETAPGDFGGYLILQLCRQNGFQMADLAASLIEVDRLVQADEGQAQTGFQHAAVSMAQYREILDQLLASDTRQAFADACWPATLFGDNYTLSDACLYPTPTVEATRVP